MGHLNQRMTLGNQMGLTRLSLSLLRDGEAYWSSSSSSSSFLAASFLIASFSTTSFSVASFLVSSFSVASFLKKGISLAIKDSLKSSRACFPILEPSLLTCEYEYIYIYIYEWLHSVILMEIIKNRSLT
jgi:hypothetical protein